jgi:flagellar biosynthesis protein FlhF
MKLKTYRAASMAEALTAVKKDLGKDAVILHTRSVKVGGVLGFGKKTVIEITAADEPVPTARRGAAARTKVETVSSAAPVPQRPILAATAAASAYRRAAEMGAPQAKQPPSPTRVELKPTHVPAPIAGPAPVVQPARAAEEPTLMAVRGRRLAEAEAAREPKPVASPRVSPFVPVDSGNGGALYRELADIKLLVNQVLHSSPASSAGVAAGAMPEALFQHYLRLLESSVSREIADAVIGAVRDELTPGEMHDESIVRTTVLRHIAGLIPVCDTGSIPSVRPGEPLVIALVGPTGVGKTTTIAKLAAAYKLRHGKSVALITSDTYRIAAVDQLRTYAGIIGLPLKVVMTPEEMAAAVVSLRGYDVVLIDTAGRSQFNADRIAELRQFVDAAGPTEVHLVLSSAASEPVLMRTAESFAALRPDRVILTKLDEAVNFGVIVNVTRRLGTALSFITTGQEVPDDIERGQPDRLARMVLDNAMIGAAVPPRPRRGVENPEREQMLAGVGGGR